MTFDRESATERARIDLAERADVDESDITTESIEDVEFPDASLDAPVEGEMAAMMITSGWRITLDAAGDSYEYRADKYQIRLAGSDGTNLIVAEL